MNDNEESGERTKMEALYFFSSLFSSPLFPLSLSTGIGVFLFISWKEK